MTMDTFRPTLLLSMPQLQDPNFARAVVLLCDFGPGGAFGLVLNRPTEMPATTMVRLDPPIVGGNGLPLCIGGPVEPERGWILMGTPPDQAEYREIQEGLYLSTSPDVLRSVLSATPAPPRARVLAGYAGWGPGQLDTELAHSSWLMGDVDLDLVFEVSSGSMWDTAIRRLGADPSALQMSRGVH
jgi:putative transcriptional regulator